MVEKPPQRHNKSRSAAKAVASNPKIASEVQPLGFIPADPEDLRLTCKGLILDFYGKIDITAYADLIPCFAGEPPPDQHPDPEHPGVRLDEQIPEGLRIWDDVRAGATDKNGAGWVAVHKGKPDGGDRKKEKWFNIRTCGSWRMAFLLARLQRIYWDERATWLKASTVAPGKGKMAEAVIVDIEPLTSSSTAIGMLSGEGQVTREARKTSEPVSPSPKNRSLESKEESVQKRAKLRELEPEKGKNTAQQSCEQPQKVSPIIGADTLASSVRLQQILAARQHQP